jgi:hypothetical protein
MPNCEAYAREFFLFLYQIAAQTTPGMPSWIIQIISLMSGAFLAVFGGFVGGYAKDFFEKRRRKDDRDQLRRALYRDLTRIFTFLVTIYANAPKTVAPHVVDLEPWKDRKQWMAPELESLAFSYSESNVLLFNEIEHADRLHRAYKKMTQWIEIEEDDPIRFYHRLNRAFRFFENEFKENRIDQTLVLDNAKDSIRKRLEDVRDGNRRSVDDATSELLSQQSPEQPYL